MTEFATKDACQLLDADHIAVKHLFVDYARLAAESAAGTEDQRTALAVRICDELTVHAQIEEEIFYPALRNALPQLSGLLDEATAEHKVAKQLISDIRSIASASPSLDTLVAELNVAIEHHVKEERDELFPKAKASGLDLLALGEELRTLQQSLQARTFAAPTGSAAARNDSAGMRRDQATPG